MTAATSDKKEVILRKTCQEVGVTYIPPPAHKFTATSIENQKRLDGMYQKIALERAKKLNKARIIDRLSQSNYGQELLLGRSIFKQLIQEKKRIAKNNGNILRIRHPILMKKLLEHESLQKYLEHRAIRNLWKLNRQGANFVPLTTDTTKVADSIVSQNLILQQPISDEIVSSACSSHPILSKNHPVPDENISSNNRFIAVVPDDALSS